MLNKSPLGYSLSESPDDSPGLVRVRSIIARITYKPGWEFAVGRVIDVSADHPLVLAVGTRIEPNADRHGETLRQAVHIPLNCLEPDEYQIVKDIFAGLREAEYHELQEWFRIDGQVFSEPHHEKFGRSREWAPPLPKEGPF